MKAALFCVPLKAGCLQQYLDFVKQTSAQKADEWKDMMKRYDISCVKIWHKHFKGTDLILVYHDVGRTFEERLKGWDDSKHPFDQWFNEHIMACYDIENVEAMESPLQLLDLQV